jgi:hypothetical protein
MESSDENSKEMIVRDFDHPRRESMSLKCRMPTTMPYNLPGDQFEN